MEAQSQVSMQLVEKAEDFVRKIYREEVSDQFYYHNLEHTLQVKEVLQELAEEAGVTGTDLEDLILSALFHDTGFARSYVDHEQHSKKIAEDFLRAHDVEERRIKQILGCIDATQMWQLPTNKLQMLIKDADTSGLGSVKFTEYTERLRKELNAVRNEGIDELGWDHINLKFLQDHQYFTAEARNRFAGLKKQNLRMIQEKLGLRKKKEKAKPKLTTIGTSKSAQTQFKTALRNHIDLSAIADGKANTMLSVTSLIISLSLPFLGTSLSSQPHLLIPTIVLLFVCVTAIIFATLATRPISMRGKSTIDDITAKRSNLFFFGNFYKMGFNEYEEGMRHVVSDDEILDNSITRDLFFLGKALGKKYFYLRWCYNVFMYGIIAAVVSFTIAFSTGAPS
ncbi:MAG: DUF5706 domain-containing protein [Saprospiraceae bacterium]|nr:DUF5706 domain-containing protein [Saprospiraceae bacterium]